MFAAAALAALLCLAALQAEEGIVKAILLVLATLLSFGGLVSARRHNEGNGKGA